MFCKRVSCRQVYISVEICAYVHLLFFLKLKCVLELSCALLAVKYRTFGSLVRLLWHVKVMVFEDAGTRQECTVCVGATVTLGLVQVCEWQDKRSLSRRSSAR